MPVTEYTGAAEWLQLIYPHLYTIWLQAKAAADETATMTLELGCQVYYMLLLKLNSLIISRCAVPSRARGCTTG